MFSARRLFAFVALMWGNQEWRVWKVIPRVLTVSTWGIGVFATTSGWGRVHVLV